MDMLINVCNRIAKMPSSRLYGVWSVKEKSPPRSHCSLLVIARAFGPFFFSFSFFYFILFYFSIARVTASWAGLNCVELGAQKRIPRWSEKRVTVHGQDARLWRFP